MSVHLVLRKQARELQFFFFLVCFLFLDFGGIFDSRDQLLLLNTMFGEPHLEPFPDHKCYQHRNVD